MTTSATAWDSAATRRFLLGPVAAGSDQLLTTTPALPSVGSKLGVMVLSRDFLAVG
jgi:hypothetical protein